MKISIALTLFITIAVFSYVSGYSISAHNKREASYRIARQANVDNNSPFTASENTSSAASRRYGSPSSEKAGGTSSPGYGTPSPGYGQ